MAKGAAGRVALGRGWCWYVLECVQALARASELCEVRARFISRRGSSSSRFPLVLLLDSCYERTAAPA